jgi:NagD protein
MNEESTGRKAFTIGKPSPVMMRSSRKALNLETTDITVIGHTMNTNIQGGVQMGYKIILFYPTLLKKEELNHYAFKPDVVVGSVKDIQFPLK